MVAEEEEEGEEGGRRRHQLEEVRGHLTFILVPYFPLKEVSLKRNPSALCLEGKRL